MTDAVDSAHPPHWELAGDAWDEAVRKQALEHGSLF
jgi:hypothetical protein